MFVDDGYKMPTGLQNLVLLDLFRITFYSGLTGLCSLTAFLNSLPQVAENLLYSILSWFLLPYSFIAYVLATEIDWVLFRDSKQGNMVLSSLYLFTFFLHFIGLIISFQSFRATVLLNKNDEEVMNAKEDVYSVVNADSNAE
jgi:hypothetical protein